MCCAVLCCAVLCCVCCSIHLFQCRSASDWNRDNRLWWVYTFFTDGILYIFDRNTIPNCVLIQLVFKRRLCASMLNELHRQGVWCVHLQTSWFKNSPWSQSSRWPEVSHGVKVGHDSKSRPALHEAEATHSPACDDDVAHNNRNQQAEMLCCVLLRQVVRGNMNVYIYIALARSGA